MDVSKAEADRRVRPDGRLLDVLVCPATKAALCYDEAGSCLRSDSRPPHRYPVRGGVMVLVAGEGEGDGVVG